MVSNLLNKKKQKFGVYEAALATLLFILYNFIFSVLYSCLPAGIKANEFFNFLANFLLSTTFALTAYTVAVTRKIDVLQATGVKKKKINSKMIWLCFWISLTLILAFGDITNLFMELLYLFGYESVLPAMTIDTIWRYLGYIIVTCATPALCEEFLFRGTILSGLKQYGIKSAVLASALIFTFMHGNAEQTIHQFIVGVLIGYLFYYSGNLWIAVFVHFFNNLIAVTATFFVSIFSDGGVSAAATTQAMTVPEAIYAVISAAIYVYFGYYLIKILVKKLLKEDEKINSQTEEKLTEQQITIDGQEQSVEMIIEGEGSSTNSEGVEEEKSEDKKDVISASTIVMFALAGLYLLGNWLITLLTGFGV